MDFTKDDLELLAAGLLGGKANLGQNLAQGLLMMRQGRSEREDRTARQQAMQTQQEIQRLQLEQTRQQMGDQTAIRNAYQGAFQPATPQTPFQADTFPGEAQPQGLYNAARPAQMDFGQLQQGLMAAGPAGFQEAARVAQMQQKQTPAPIKLGAGDVLYDPSTGKQMFQAPQKTPDWKDPEYQAFQMKKAAAGAARVNVDNKQETEFAKAVGKEYGTQFTDLMKADSLATSKITRFQRLESLLKNAGTTGKFTPLAKDLASAAQSLGIKVDETKLGTQEAVEGLTNEIALQLRNPAGGAGMPGALSDQDRAFLQNMVPGLGKTPQGNKMMIQTALKLAQRERDVAKLARQYKQQTGKFDDGFYQVLADWSAQNPLFADSAAPAPAAGGWSATRVN